MIKRRNHAVTQQHKAPYDGTNTVDVDDTEIQSSYASSVQLGF